MCGIAGFSLSPTPPSSARSPLRRSSPRSPSAAPTRSATRIATPGAPRPTVVKQRTPASELLERVAVPADASQLLIHVRDYTKGHPSIAANNHPVRHGPVVGIHNGIIVNDDALLEGHACARPEPRMTVDSEAILALAAHSRSDARALEQLRGSMAAAWIDERDPEVLYAARGMGRPLWLGQGRDGHRLRLDQARARARRALLPAEAAQARAARGHVRRAARRRDRVAPERFRATEFVEDDPLPAVRAPHEREVCLTRLAAIAAAF